MTTPAARRPRLRYVVAAVVVVGALGFLFTQLQSNALYFRTVSEALADRDAQGGESSRFRLAGEVLAGSVRETDDGVVFSVTDGAATAHVRHRGDPPQLFADGVPVVCEGRWDGSRFESDRILIRHGNEYKPPEVTSTGAVRQ